MKSVAFKMPVKAVDPADAWVQARGAEEAPSPAPAATEAMKRFTIDVPVSLHTRIKAQCALKGLKMADVLREMLEREFPKA
jgi:ParG